MLGSFINTTLERFPAAAWPGLTLGQVTNCPGTGPGTEGLRARSLAGRLTQGWRDHCPVEREPGWYLSCPYDFTFLSRLTPYSPAYQMLSKELLCLPAVCFLATLNKSPSFHRYPCAFKILAILWVIWLNEHNDYTVIVISAGFQKCPYRYAPLKTRTPKRSKLKLGCMLSSRNTPKT